MANRDNPCGFTPVGMFDGSEIPTRLFPATSVGSNLFVGDLVKAMAAGDVDPSAAGDGDIVVGCVVALYDSNKNPIGHPNSSISTKYIASGSSGYALVALALPGAIFQVQSDTGTTVAETSRFATADHVAGTGNTTTAKSGHELDSSAITTGASEQLKIIDKVDEPNNAWGDAHVDLLVVFSESYWFDSTAGL